MNHALLTSLGVSHSSLEKIKEISIECGCPGMKLTGGGGGGCCVILLPAGDYNVCDCVGGGFFQQQHSFLFFKIILILA